MWWIRIHKLKSKKWREDFVWLSEDVIGELCCRKGKWCGASRNGAFPHKSRMKLLRSISLEEYAVRKWQRNVQCWFIRWDFLCEIASSLAPCTRIVSTQTVNLMRKVSIKKLQRIARDRHSACVSLSGPCVEYGSRVEGPVCQACVFAISFGS